MSKKKKMSTKDIPSPGMAHASIHTPWKLEQEAEGLHAQAEYIREQFDLLDLVREAARFDKPYYLSVCDVYALVELIDGLFKRIETLEIEKQPRTYEGVEVKTIGQLLDELNIENLKIWHLVDEAKIKTDPTEQLYVQDQIQDHNDIRRDLVRAIDRRLGERDIGGRV